MDEMTYTPNGKDSVLRLCPRIDSANSAQAEETIRAFLEKDPPAALTVDCSALEYISSAGLRVLLRLKKAVPETRLVNVSSDVYEIFEMTGFTEMMEIRKAYRVVSVENCEVIGQGANGKIYRIEPETIVKVFLNPDALPEIQRERELARTAFVLGVPTAIPYDVVRIEGGGYGSVFELLNSKSLSSMLASGSITLEEAAQLSIDLLHQIHGTVVQPDSMPDMRAVALGWAEFLRDYLPAEAAEKLYSLVEAVPVDDHMLHGDFHLKNVMMQNGECLLIDMDTLCHGHPVFELASMFNAYRGFSELDPEEAAKFQGISREDAARLWELSLRLYLGTEDEAKLKAVEDKAMLIGFARLMRRAIRRKALETEKGRRQVDVCRAHIEELLSRVDSLVF